MSTYSRPWDMTLAVLAAVQAEFTLAAVALPDRQFATSGMVIYDAEQLSVSLVRMSGAELHGEMGPAGTSQYPQYATSWRAADFEVMLLRCAPLIDVLVSGELRAPSIADQAAHGQAVAQDAQVITQGLLRAWGTDNFGPGPNIALGAWQAVGESDLTGGMMTVRIGLV